MLRAVFDTFLGREVPKDIHVWHKWVSIVPMRLINGGYSHLDGQLWRRMNESGRWEYDWDKPTDEERSRDAW